MKTIYEERVQNLFNYLSQEFNITILESEFHDIKTIIGFDELEALSDELERLLTLREKENHVMREALNKIRDTDIHGEPDFDKDVCTMNFGKYGNIAFNALQQVKELEKEND